MCGSPQIVFLFYCFNAIVLSNGLSIRYTEYPTLKVAVVPVHSENPIKDAVIMEKPTKSDLVVGKGEEIPLDSRLIFHCEAPYPVQFLYSGNGLPEYTTNTSQNHNQNGSESEISTRPVRYYQAQLHLGFGRQLGSYDTGKYACRSFQDRTKSSHYYLFVSDGKMFARSEGENMIYFKRTEPFVEIPCGATHPNAVVTLQKVANGLVTCPMNESISFDPISGFRIKTTTTFNPEGTYLCTASRDGKFQAMQFVVNAEDDSEKLAQLPRTTRCQRNDDCDDSEGCLKNGYCGSPCSQLCGQHTTCQVENHRTTCKCLPGHYGCPYMGCKKPDSGGNQQQDRPAQHHQQQQQQHQSQHQQGARPECETDHDCSYSQICRRSRCRNPCDGACDDIPNSTCRVVNRRPVCARQSQIRASSGSIGIDTKDEQTPSSLPVEEESFQRIISPCVPFPCGVDAECHTHLVKNAEMNETSLVALCQCPSGKTGNAASHCFPIQSGQRVESISSGKVARDDLKYGNWFPWDMLDLQNLVDHNQHQRYHEHDLLFPFEGIGK